MNNLDNHSIMKLIDIDKIHIENFVLKTEEGTKRYKEKFYLKSVNDRNKYVNRQINIFKKYLNDIENEMVERVNKLMPINNSEKHEKARKEIQQLLNLVFLNANCSSSFKLKFDYIIADITKDTSLEDVHQLIKKFIQEFSALGINLSINDFTYSMFTEQYMRPFFKNSSFEEMKNIFEKIYFRCPDIILHLKMNLIYILERYKTKIDKYVLYLKKKKFIEYGVDELSVVKKYIEIRLALGHVIATDSYNNTKLFLTGEKKICDFVEGSPTRNKIYDMFACNNNYNDLSKEAKKNYNSAVMDLYVTLKELKKYYNYEFLLKDLLLRYKDKDSHKGQYASKKKEIDKEEKRRQAIYKAYLKATGKGIFSIKNDDKISNSMLKMNEEIHKLNNLYEELRDLEITNSLNELSESASIYDLFTCALTSFSFLEKSFKNQENFQESTIEDSLSKYFKFIYNPSNSLLRKINVFADYDIVSVVAEKYKLLNLTITSDMINRDNIDSTIDSLEVINLIQNIEKSSISLHEIDILCQMKNIIEESKNNN